MALIELDPFDDEAETINRLVSMRYETPAQEMAFLARLRKAVDAEIEFMARNAPDLTWQQIGDALGVSRQAAHKRFGP